MLTNLPQWTGTAGNLRQTGNGHSAADPKQTPDDWHPSAEQWIGGATERGDLDDERPGERLPVFATWGDPQRQLCEVVVAVRALASEAGALSFMSLGAHDIRPAMLLCMFGQDQAATLACLEYGRRYLLAWSNRSGMVRADLVLRTAAADALAKFYRARDARLPGMLTPKRAIPSADYRAFKLGVRAQDFRLLRLIAMKAYRLRLREACINFHTGRIRTGELSNSEVEGMSPPIRNPSRALPPDIWQQLFEWVA